MGTQNRRSSKTWDLNAIELNRKKIQEDFNNNRGIENRRRLGQFATPFELSQEIISYGLKLQKDSAITYLEPAFGTGSFYSALLCECSKQSKSIISATGIELDKDYFDAAYDLWSETGINLINADFFDTECVQKVNFLVTNPPYVRHHYISQERKSSLSEKSKNISGIMLSRLSGLYCYFVLSAHNWLAPNAICGWLIPSEFMDVNYGKEVKDYLLNKVHLLRVHRYNPNNCKFDDALVSSCVVWFKNETVKGNYDVEFTYGGTHEMPEKSTIVDRETLSAYKKWTHFPRKENPSECLYNSDSLTLGDFFTIKRGLATGDNDFFILPKSKIDDLGLDMELFTPILPSPRYLKCDVVFCDEDGIPCLDPQYFLLNCNIPENDVRVKYPSLWNYLSNGKNTTGQKYLCRNRRVWYYQENRASTPFLCSYMGRGCKGHAAPFRFILNHSKAIATNSYLMLYPKNILKSLIDESPDIVNTVWEYLTGIASNDLESEGRVYGGGLKKIEPKELANVKCPDLAKLL